MDNYEVKYTAEHAIRLQYGKAIAENLPTDKASILQAAILELKDSVENSKALHASMPQSNVDFSGLSQMQGQALLVVTGQLADVKNMERHEMSQYTLYTDAGPVRKTLEGDMHAINWARLHHLRANEHVTLMGANGILAIMKGGVNTL